MLRSVHSTVSLSAGGHTRPFQPQWPRPSQSRKRLVLNAGLFDSLSFGRRGTGKAQELVEELLTESRAASSKPSNSQKEQIAQLAEQLRQYRPRAPTRSPLFWGDYEVVFSSNPNATGGPVLRSAPGQLLLAGQQPRQRLQQPGTLINSVQFKTLGLIPGTATQQGTLAILDGNRYEVNFEPAAVNRGESITRRFEVLFLDERVRVVQFLPEEEDRGPVLFIFERVAEEDTEEQEPEGKEEVPAYQPPRGGTRRQAVKDDSRKQTQSPADRQVEELLASLNGWSERSKTAAQELNTQQMQLPITPTLDSREKERGASGAARMSGPARAQVTRIQQEVGGLEQQLATAVEAAQAAESRYQQAATEVRQIEREAR